MSKNIVIQEGGQNKQLTVDKLKTNLVDSGTCLWVPEDEVQLTTKFVTKNGTYKASDDGYYGYSEVTVSGVGSATGIDGDGDEAVAYTDPGTGALVTDKVPSRIEVVTPPTNPYGIYVDGQTITTDGMVVKAYLASGDEYGTAPNGEITLNPTTAVYDQSQDHGITGDATIEDTSGLTQDTINALPIGYGTQVIGSSQAYETGTPGGISDAIISLTHTTPVYTFSQYDNVSDEIPFACSTEPFSGVITTHNPGGINPYTRNIGSSQANVNGKVVYWAQVLGSGGWNLSTPPVNSAHAITEVAYVILYGTRDEKPAGSHQTINVSWPRPGDGKVLETTFEIRVGPSPSGDDDQ